jgi:hypothetical protein
MAELTAIAGQEVIIEIGGVPIAVRSESAEFARMLEGRYSTFLNPAAVPLFEFEVELVPPGRITNKEDISVSFEDGRWLVQRSDLRAEWVPGTGRGRIVQSANPYSIEVALRIFHSLMLANEGGLLVHAASAVRHGKAYFFAGVSGAGKTTISRLAPADVLLLTDEISYVRRTDEGFVAFGTPFAGELAKVGENVQAPLAAVYLLQQGPENRIEPVQASDAVRLLMANVLFFANDAELVGKVFETACELVCSVPVHRLTFLPDERVWDMVGDSVGS